MNPGDRSFRHYRFKHRLIAWISQHLFDRVTYTVRHGLLKGMRRRGGLGFLPKFVVGRGETPETRFWRGVDLRGQVVCDVGAFQGLLSLFFARQARLVVCYEPHRGNYQRLTENLELNALSHVVARQMGVGDREGRFRLVWSPLMPGGASLEPATASALERSGGWTEQISVTTLDQEVQAGRLPPPDLVKIDIEGYELQALQGARRLLWEHHPALFLEMHGETMNEKRRKAHELVVFLNGLGYHDIRHVESGAAITGANSDEACQGHWYCPRGHGEAG